MNKHTPGPWIPRINRCEVEIKKDEFSSIGCYAGTVENTLLIAGSPDLLEAAQEVVSFMEGRQPIKGWLRDTDGSRTALSKLIAAIAKATGAPA